MSEWVPIKAAAAELGVSRATVYREMDDGKLAWVKIRSRRFIERAELDRYIAVIRAAVA